MDNEKLDILKINTGWINFQVVSEPDVLLTFKGYAPVLRVRVEKSGLEKHIYISAKSLAEKLEPMRKENNGVFTGLNLKAKKTSEDRFAPYAIERVDS